MKRISLDMITSWKVLVPALVIIAVAMTPATFVAKSNTDYICTRIIEDESACAIDEWTGWADVGTGDPEPGAVAGTGYQVVQQRVGTGTKILSQVIEYLNLRSACTAGFTQRVHGSGGGVSGYIAGTGKTFTTSAVCQIEETRTITRTVPNPDDPECAYAGAPGCDIVDGEVTVNETTGTVTTGGETALDGISAINEFRRTMIDANIAVIPALVSHDGDTTEVRWTSKETTSCNVVGDNGDRWDVVAAGRDEDGNITTPADSRTSGTETSNEIHGRTVYTLTCTAFDGSTVEDTAVVDRIPNWNEQ